MTTIHDKAIILNDLANSYAMSLRYTKAIARYKEALALYLSLAKKEPSNYGVAIAHVFSNLAIIHLNLHKFKEAEEFHKNSLKMHRVLVRHNYKKYAIGYATCIMEGVHYLKQHALMLHEAEGLLHRFYGNPLAEQLLRAIKKLRESGK